MPTTTTTTSRSTPVGPLILFLVLCLLFQLPTFTKASDSLVRPASAVEGAISIPLDFPKATKEETLHLLPQADDTYNNNNNNVNDDVDENTTTPTNILLARLASPAPQYTSALQPQVIIQTYYTTIPATVSSTQPYPSPTSTTTYTVTASTPSPQPLIATTTTTVRGFITTNSYNGQQYCSTLYANGGGLPTTRAGNCGIILVEEPPAAAANAAQAVMRGEGSRVALVAVVVGAVVVGAVG